MLLLCVLKCMSAGDSVSVSLSMQELAVFCASLTMIRVHK